MTDSSARALSISSLPSFFSLAFFFFRAFRSAFDVEGEAGVAGSGVGMSSGSGFGVATAGATEGVALPVSFFFFFLGYIPRENSAHTSH